MKMSRSKSLLALAASATLSASATWSGGSVVLFNGPFFGVTPVAHGSAEVDDFRLGTYFTFDLKVVVSSASGQDRWTSADMRVTLLNGGSGGFYIPPALDSNYLQAPAVRNQIGQRFLQMDNMVMSPVFSDSRGSITGKSVFAPASQTGPVFPSDGSNLPNGTGFVPANDQSVIDVAWADPQAGSFFDNADGTFTIARITLPVGRFFVLQGRITSLMDPAHPTTFVISDLPEPACATMLGAGFGAVCLRRRRDQRLLT
jgi:hypothetical protein